MRHSLSLFLVLLTAAPALHAQRLSVPRAVQVQPTAAAPLAMPVNNGTIATLRPGDVFEMRLSGMPAEYAGDFNLQYSVGSEGTVSVPLIGEMRAAGLTASQLERQVESKLVNDKIFTHPTVLINIAQATRYVSISGGVRQPQRLSWSNDLTLSSAIGNCAEPAGTVLRDQNARQAIQDAATRAGVTVIDPTPWLCSRRCPLVVGDLLVYRDTNHLTTAYAQSLAPLLSRALPRPARTRD